MVNITGIDKPYLLLELYKNAKVQDPSAVTDEEFYRGNAADLLFDNSYIDTINGRTIKIDFLTDEVDETEYDKANGEGKLQEVVEYMRTHNYDPYGILKVQPYDPFYEPSKDPTINFDDPVLPPVKDEWDYKLPDAPEKEEPTPTPVPKTTDEKVREEVSEDDYDPDWYPSEEPELDDFIDIESDIRERVVDSPDEPILTAEELDSMRKFNIPSNSAQGKFKEEKEKNDVEFISKKQKEIGGIIRDYFDIRNIVITPEYVNDLLKEFYETKNPLVLQSLLDYVLQPDLYKFFEEIYKELKFDSRSDYKDLEYLWINTESIIKSKILSGKVKDYTSIKESFIPSVLTLNPMLVFHESDSRDDFEDERYEYRELHGFIPRIPIK